MKNASPLNKNPDMNEEISVLIIEDEAIWSDSISMNLQDFGYAVAGIARTFEDAVVALGDCTYDVVLLDIFLNNRKSGVELGKLISAHYRKPYIYITSVSDKAILKEAVAAGPSAYLAKPVTPVTLIATIQTAINNFNNQVVADGRTEEDYSFFFIKTGNKYKKIAWKDVVCMRSDKKYTSLFYAPDKTEYYIKSTLTNTLRYVVPPALQNKFIQVNRAEAVQVSFITEYAGDEIKTAYRSLTISDTFTANLRKELRLTL